MTTVTTDESTTNRPTISRSRLNRTAVETAGNLLAAERIKLLANRSLWWCAGVAVLWVPGTVAASALMAPDGPVRGDEGVGFAVLLVIVLAVLAVTGEYRHRTIRATFLAMPNRTAALLAKAGVVACAASVVALLVGLSGHAMAAVLRPERGWQLSLLLDWRSALVIPLYAVIAVTAAILVRHTAGAIALVLAWLVVQVVMPALPGVDYRLTHWLPFVTIDHFWTADDYDPSRRMFVDQMPMGPWGSLAYSAAIVGLGLALALFVANRRDA